MLNLSKEDCFVLGGLAAVVVWTYGVVPFLQDQPLSTWIAAISATAAAFSAYFAAKSAKINSLNSQRQFENSQRQFEETRRQLKEANVNACLNAAKALEYAVYKTIEHKAGGADLGVVLGIYEGEAWKSWVLLAQTFSVARQYDKRLEDFDAPGMLADLLSKLRPSLCLPSWDGEGPNNIRPEVERIVAEIHTKVGVRPL
jgi:hypothetical protein